MIFFDTDILVYSAANLDMNKQKIADQRIETALLQNSFMISPLVLSELIYIFSKLKIRSDIADKAIALYGSYIYGAIDALLVREAYDLCKSLNVCLNVNDAIHFLYAKKYCNHLITFDKDFKRFLNSGLTIEILQ